MKVPLSWLRDYVELPASVPFLVERLTLAGLEVASVRTMGVAVPEGLHVKQEDAGPVWQPDQIVEQYPVTHGRIVHAGRRHRRDRPLFADYLLQIEPGFPVAVVEANGAQ